MSNLHFHLESTCTPAGHPVSILVISGFVSASTEDIFQNALAQLRACEGNIAFDFTSVAYINSTSFGELAACAHDLTTSGRRCCLFSLRADSLFLFRQIGLEQMLPVRSTREDALAYLDHPEWTSGQSGGLTVKPAGVGHRTSPFSPALGKGRVLAVMNPADPLLPVLWRLLRHREFPITESARDVSAQLRQGPVEVAVVDCSHPEYHTVTGLLAPAHKGGAAALLHLGCGGAFPHLPARTVEQALLQMKQKPNVSPVERRKREVAAELLLRGARLELRSDAKSCELGRLICQRMALAAGMNRSAADSFFFAVREAIDNACTHGNRLDNARCVRVGFQVRPGMLELLVTDEGTGFDYDPWLEAARLGPLAQAKRRVDEGAKGGLGITLMRCCCDDVTYLPPGNTVRLCKMIPDVSRL